MPVDDAPEDNDTRETYNFAPGYHGLVYRADIPDYGAGNRRPDNPNAPQDDGGDEGVHEGDTVGHDGLDVLDKPSKTPKYKLQAMKWGENLIIYCIDFY